MVVKKTLWQRFKDLLAKFMSVKGVVFITATVLLGFGVLAWWGWILVAFALIGVRYFEKVAGFTGPEK